MGGFVPPFSFEGGDMKVLYIDAERQGYTPGQVYETCTVGDLADRLSRIASVYGDDTPVYLRHDGGYTYGGLTDWSFNVEDCDDLDDEEDEEE